MFTNKLLLSIQKTKLFYCFVKFMCLIIQKSKIKERIMMYFNLKY